MLQKILDQVGGISSLARQLEGRWKEPITRQAIHQWLKNGVSKKWAQRMALHFQVPVDSLLSERGRRRRWQNP